MHKESLFTHIKSTARNGHRLCQLLVGLGNFEPKHWARFAWSQLAPDPTFSATSYDLDPSEQKLIFFVSISSSSSVSSQY